MTITTKKFAPGKIRLVITIMPPNYEKYLRGTALKMGEKIRVPGFRPGKAPYEMLKSHFGEMQLLSEALKTIVRETYHQAVEEQRLKPALPPKIEVLKMAPGNPLEYQADVVVLPAVTWPELSKIKIKVREVQVAPEQAAEALKHLQKMRASEALKNSPIQLGDRVELDIKIAGGGDQAGETLKNQVLTLGETQLLPGFIENLTGLKAGDEKVFQQEFPPAYHLKKHAGQKVDIAVRINKVWQVNLPPLDDEFAQRVNPRFKTLEELKIQLTRNIKLEEEQMEKQRQEQEMLELLVKMSKFSEIAEELLEDVKKRMIEEKRLSIEQGGGEWSDYLKRVKKSETDLKNELSGEAEKRIKIDTIIAQVVVESGIKVSNKEVVVEINKFLEQFPSVRQAQKQVDLAQLQAIIKGRLLNRRAISWLKDHINFEGCKNF